ncbi:hypothetical protein MP228_001934 [Amoeboaphelidium protococcarum]|nr:hypothetical protein MP228_001934 [Amoeboaphelidium protococcarum]
MQQPPPAQLKQLGPFLQRSQELQSRAPVVSYYCKYYAAKMGLAVKDRDKDSTQYLVKLLDQLESEKSTLCQNEEFAQIMTNDDLAYEHISDFALKIFYQADAVDRKSALNSPDKPPPKSIAPTFLAANIFMQVLSVFGQTDPSVDEKIKYSKWRAAEISKAVKENRPASKPTSLDDEVLDLAQDLDQAAASDQGASSQNVDSFDSSSMHKQQSSQSSLPQSPTAFNQQQQSYSGRSFQQQPISPASQKLNTPGSASRPTSQTSFNAPPTYNNVIPVVLDPSVSDQAVKHCRYVISALQYDDLPTAIRNLEEALSLLKSVNQS